MVSANEAMSDPVTNWTSHSMHSADSTSPTTKVNSAFHPSGVGKWSTGLHGWG